jgi:DNA-binding transcriptional ArsR family regulator
VRKLDEQDDDAMLDSVFSALSDPVRRRILKRLESGPLLVSELAEPFEISLQAVSRHIQVLHDAGLIQKERTGRISRCSLEIGPMINAAVWINRYSKYWQDQFELLAARLTELDRPHAKSAVRGARAAARPVEERRRSGRTVKGRGNPANERRRS